MRVPSKKYLVSAAWEVNALIAMTRRSLQRFLPSTMSCSWLIAAKERPHFGHHVGTAAAHLPFSQLQNNIVNILVEISNAVLTLFHVGKFTVAPPERGPRLLYFFYFSPLWKITIRWPPPQKMYVVKKHTSSATMALLFSAGFIFARLTSVRFVNLEKSPAPIT